MKDIYVYGPACDFLHTQTQKVVMDLMEHGYMDLYVALPDVVRPYMSGADNVAAFVGHYLLKMKGSAGDKMSFRYYCDSLKHVFVTEECARYTDATSWGSEAEYNVLPLETAFKLVNMRAVFTVDYYEAINTELAEGDMLAAFVGDECRGVARAERTSYFRYGCDRHVRHGRTVHSEVLSRGQPLYVHLR